MVMIQLEVKRLMVVIRRMAVDHRQKYFYHIGLEGRLL